MSVKKDLLAEIEAKAQKIKDRKIKTSSKTELEKLVFEFFKEAESLGKMIDLEHMLLHEAGLELQSQIAYKIDMGVRVEIIYNDQHQVDGVMVYWSKSHQIANKSEEQIFIGVEQMLFN